MPYTLPSSSLTSTSIDLTGLTFYDISGISSSAKRITLTYKNVTGQAGGDATKSQMLRLGTSGGIETTGYVGWQTAQFISQVAAGAGWLVNVYSGVGTTLVAANTGIIIIQPFDAANNIWLFNATHAPVTGNSVTCQGSGSKQLADTLTTVRLTWENTPTNVYGGGTLNYLIET